MQRIIFAGIAGILLTSNLFAASQIRGEYLEARTCDVYTGPCFANAEWSQGGKEAVLAWMVEKGTWNDIDVSGLGVALVLQSEKTLDNDGVFAMAARKVRSLILVDEKADSDQRDALVAFVKHTAETYTENIVRVIAAPLSLNNDHITGEAKFKAGEFAAIETRGLRKNDCVCTNELVYYQPLTKVKDASPAYTNSVRYEGPGMDSSYDMRGLRSAFLATFRI